MKPQIKYRKHGDQHRVLMVLSDQQFLTLTCLVNTGARCPAEQVLNMDDVSKASREILRADAKALVDAFVELVQHVRNLQPETE